MRIQTKRFGSIEANEKDLLHFDEGLIGFPEEHDFVLIPHPKSEAIAWLQSTSTPELAIPVVSAHSLPPSYPDVSLEEIAEQPPISSRPEDLALMVVLSAPPNEPATVNLAAPVVINASQRRGAQVLLDGSRFSTRELYISNHKLHTTGNGSSTHP